ncbi:MAG: hypothetical protein LBH32_00240 [Dysgonamonadaceae bacterium]|jgi:hypothetical protein|nr:hypothetical protein [Dysgonamonadaceae bacterium]
MQKSKYSSSVFETGALHLGIIFLFISLVFFYFTPVINRGAWRLDLSIWANLTDVLPVFAGLCCAYCFFALLTENIRIAFFGAVCHAFSSGNILLVGNEQFTQVWAIACMPLLLAGFLLITRKKYVLGGFLFALSVFLELLICSVNVIYYLSVFCIIMYAGCAFNLISRKDIKTFFLITLTFSVALSLAVFPCTTDFYSNNRMGEENGFFETDFQSSSNRKTWSYAKEEALCLIIPNIRGGASVSILKQDSRLFKEHKLNHKRTGVKIQTCTYWGNLPFSSGPVYAGACVCFLFILGMFIIKNKIKWWILAAVLFLILASGGKNWTIVNDFLLKYLPMYENYRNPSSAMLILATIFPLIAAWGLKTLFHHRNMIEKRRLKLHLFISLGLTIAICLFFYLLPNVIYNFKSPNDTRFILKYPEWYYGALVTDRLNLLKMDALRSVAFILASGGSVFFFIKRNKKGLNKYVIILIVLVIIDLWMVDKRY